MNPPHCPESQVEKGWGGVESQGLHDATAHKATSRQPAASHASWYQNFPDQARLGPSPLYQFHSAREALRILAEE